MQPPGEGTVTPLTAGMRGILYVASGLVLVEGLILSVFADQTSTYFAWTVNPPLTAAFLGGAYLAAFVLELLAARARDWAHARVAVPAVLIFTTLTLVASLLHLDRFHLGAATSTAQWAAWAWLAIYALVPPILFVLLLLQLRVRGVDPPRAHLLPAWLRTTLWVQAAVMLLLGAALFLAPQAVAPLWPWTLTPLTGRAVGAWLLGIGIAAAHMAWENEFDRARIGLLAYAIFAVLELVALLRYAGTVDWAGPRGWIYVLFLLSILGVGVYGWFGARGATHASVAPAPLAPPTAPEQPTGSS
jgi:hypothetical protein